jgi:hypothetical protein
MTKADAVRQFLETADFVRSTGGMTDKQIGDSMLIAVVAQTKAALASGCYAASEAEAKAELIQSIALAFAEIKVERQAG